MTGRFGFWTLVFLVVANMIGAGVFTTSGYSLASLGSPHVVMTAWCVGGLVAICGAISYGMLVSYLPESGGEYLFLAKTVHPLVGFIAGWISILVGFSGAIAFAATAFEAYLLPDEMRPTWLTRDVVASAAVVVAGCFHGLSPRLGAWLQNATVVLKSLLLVAFVGMALWCMQGQAWDGWANASRVEWNREQVYAFAASLVWISLSYSGFNAAVYVASEVDDAERRVPMALSLGTLAVFLAYLVLNGVFVYAAPADAIAGKEDVAALAASVVGGAWLEAFVRLTIAACLLTSVFSMMMAAPRVYAKMAEDGLMPKAVSFQAQRPVIATLAQIVIAVVLIWFSSLKGLLDYLGLTLSLCAATAVASLFLLVIRKELKATWLLIFPAVYVAATLLIAALRAISDPWQIVGVLVTLVVCLVIYGVTQGLSRDRKTRAL